MTDRTRKKSRHHERPGGNPRARGQHVIVGIAAILLGCGALPATPVFAEDVQEFTIRLVKGDSPDELVERAGTAEKTAGETGASEPEKDEQEDAGGRPAFFELNENPGGQDAGRVVTWIRGFSVNGKKVFQRRYRGRFLERRPVATVELGDGEHLLEPGHHVLTVQDGKATASSPDIVIDGQVISVRCYPVFFGGLDISMDESLPLMQRFTRLPGKYFSVQAYHASPDREDEAGGPSGDGEAGEPAEGAWRNVLVSQQDFEPLIVYLPPNTAEKAYRILPSHDGFTLSEGKIDVSNPYIESGVRVDDAQRLWIPRYEQRVIVRQKTHAGLDRDPADPLMHVAFDRAAAGTGTKQGPADEMEHVPALTMEQWRTYALLPDRRPRSFKAGLPDRKRPAGLSVKSDFAAFPHRQIVADNRHPATDAALHLAVSLDKNTAGAGETIRTRVQRGAMEAPVFAEPQVRAFYRLQETARAPWREADLAPVEKDPALYDLAFAGDAEGLHDLRIVVDDAGTGSPTSLLHADFEIALEGARTPPASVSTFTHYNRESFYEGSGIELNLVVKTAGDLAGDLEMFWRHEDAAAGEAIRTLHRKVAYGKGTHRDTLDIPPGLTALLKPGRYRVWAELDGAVSHGTHIVIVARKKKSSAVIAMQGGGFAEDLLGWGNERGRNRLIDQLQATGINQIISPLKGLGEHPVDRTRQERVDVSRLESLPPADYRYQPDQFAASMDRFMAAGIDAWYWRNLLVENLRWGPFPELDEDRFTMQYMARKGKRWPNHVGIDMSWWLSIHYADMGVRPGLRRSQQQRVREALLARRFEARYGHPIPQRVDLQRAFSTGENHGPLKDLWLKQFYMNAGLLEETTRQYTEAIHRVNEALDTTALSFEVTAQGRGHAVVPEIMYKPMALSRWGNYTEVGSRPLNTAFQTALGKYSPDARVSTIHMKPAFHGWSTYRSNPHHVWQRSFLALAAGADEIGYSGFMQHMPIHTSRKTMRGGREQIGLNHLNEFESLRALNRTLHRYSDLYRKARRDRKVAILYSQTQRGLEHNDLANEWHGVNNLYLREQPPFHRGTQQIRVFGAYYALLAAQMPADIVTEISIQNGRLDDYDGLVITGLETALPADVQERIEAYTKKGGTVLMDGSSIAKVPGTSNDIRGAHRLDFDFDIVRKGWYTGIYPSLRDAFSRIRGPVREMIEAHFGTPWADSGDPEVYTLTSSWGQSTFLTVSADRIPHGAFNPQFEREPVLTRVTLQEPDAVVYDLVAQRRVDVRAAEDGTCSFLADLADVGSKLYAVLPAEPAAPALRVTGRLAAGEGLAVEVRARRDAAGETTRILTPIEIRIEDPGGRERYRVYRSVAGASPHEETFKIARNERAGRWRVRVTELFSGRATQATSDVRPADGDWPQVASTPAVSVYGAEAIRQFLMDKAQVRIVYSRDDEGVAAIARRAAELLETREIKATVTPVDRLRREAAYRLAFLRQSRIAFPLGEDVVILDRRGSNALLGDLDGMLPVRPGPSFPADGRAAIMHAVSPFQYGHDALIITGGDNAGLGAALDRLADLEGLEETFAGAVRSVARAGGAMTEGSGQAAAGDVSPIYDRDLVGIPVTHLRPSADGEHVLVGLAHLGDNLYLLGPDGKTVWRGKGSQKLFRQLSLTAAHEVVALDESGTLYFLDAEGRTVRRVEALGKAAISADGQRMIVSDRDRTYGVAIQDRQLEELWDIDYFPERKTWDEMARFTGRDTGVDLSPDGEVGLVFRGATEMRIVEMANGKTQSRFSFHPTLLSSPHADLRTHFSADSSLLVATTHVGHVYLLARRKGRYELVNIYETPPLYRGDGMPAHLNSAPSNNLMANPLSFMDIDRQGRALLLGFASGDIVLLDGEGREQVRHTWDGPVGGGTLLENGFAVYAEGKIRWFDDQGSPRTTSDAPFVYTMNAMPDGQSIVCGTPGGRVFVERAGTGRGWQRRIAMREGDDVRRELAKLDAAEPVTPRRFAPFESEMAQIKAAVRLSDNLLPPVTAGDRWRRQHVETTPGGVRIEAGGHLAFAVDPERVSPLDVYILEVHATAIGVPARIAAEVAIVDQDPDADPSVVRRSGHVSIAGTQTLVLPVKMSPDPASVEVHVSMAGGEQADITAIRMRAMDYGMDNILRVPEAIAGNTKEARESLRTHGAVEFRVIGDQGGRFNMERVVETVEMVDSRLHTEQWSPGGKTGGVELTFKRPRNIGGVTFFDDPRAPDRYIDGYFIDYYHLLPEPPNERREDEPDVVDELDFEDTFAGEWRRLETVRQWHGPVHTHVFDRPVRTNRIRIIGFAHNDGAKGIRISEIEAYEVAWPTAGGDFSRRRHVKNGRLGAKLEQAGKLHGGGATSRKPNRTELVHADGIRFLGHELYLVAQDMAEGENLWTLETDERRVIGSTPTITADMAVFGSDDYLIRAVDRDRGRVLWSFLANFKVIGSPVVTDEKVIQGSVDGVVYCLDRQTGKPVWQYDTGLGIRSSVASDGRHVYFTSGDGRIHAVSVADGQPAWTFDMGAASRSGVAIAGRSVYAGADDGAVYAVSKETGELRWKFQTADFVEAAPAVDEHTVYIGSRDGKFRAIDRDRGTLRWEKDVGRPITSAALIMGETVLFHANGKRLWAVDVKTGEVIDSLSTGRRMLSTPPAAYGLRRVAIGQSGGGYVVIE